MMHKCRWRSLSRILLLALILIDACLVVAVAEPRIGVIYPQSSGVYKQVFISMLSGIKEHDGVDVFAMELPQEPDIDKVNEWLAGNAIDSAITLGSTGFQLAADIPDNVPVTVGAVVMAPDHLSGISLAGDPALFIEHLHILAPDVKRVFIVYSEQNTGWLVQLAEKAAAKHRIELVATPVENTREGVLQYDKVLEMANGTGDAIWIPLDTIVPDKVILPKLLRAAWDENIVLFSNNPLHAKKGVLFALFPDHKDMGYELGKLAIEQIRNPKSSQVLPARSLKLAVNKRTASHLGFSYSKSLQRQFDIIFPSE